MFIVIILYICISLYIMRMSLSIYILSLYTHIQKHNQIHANLKTVQYTLFISCIIKFIWYKNILY